MRNNHFGQRIDLSHHQLHNFHLKEAVNQAIDLFEEYLTAQNLGFMLILSVRILVFSLK